MAALETFEWWVAGMSAERRAGMQKFILDQREYLYTLRSEDERQRFVADLIEQIRRPPEQSAR